jgi:uroporphyrinogen-III synthase
MSALHGRRVLITRARDDAEEWADALRAAGADAIVFPCIECELLDDAAHRCELAAALADADWLVLTSRRGVEAVQTLRPEPLPPGLKLAAVGPATARAAESAFGPVALISARGTAADLAATLVATVGRTPAVRSGEDAGRNKGTTPVAAPGPGKTSATPPGTRRGAHPVRVVAAVAENAPTVLETALRKGGLDCTRVNVYRTLPAGPDSARTTLSALGAECILLASPSAVTGLTHRLDFDRDAAIYTIGPSTTAAAQAQGLVVTAQAREPTLQGLLEIMQCAN